MKVTFINPYLPDVMADGLIHPPLGIGMLSASLKKIGHEVSLIDMPIEEISLEELDQHLIDAAPDLIGIQDLTHIHYSAIRVAQKCKMLLPNVPIMLGGPHATFTPIETLERNLCIDFVCLYESDYTIGELLEGLEGKRTLDSIKSLAYRENGTVKINEIAPPIQHLDSLPKTDRSIFNNAKYLKRDFETMVLSARGCPGKCKFCSTSKMGRRLRVFSVERLCDEIEECLALGFKSFFIADDTFAFSIGRMQAFANEIENRNLKFKWTSNIRIKDINIDTVKLMKESGAYRVFTGLETINFDSSTLINKNIKKDEIREKIKMLHDHGIEVHASFIIGSPGDTDEILENTIEFIREIKPELATFNKIIIYPGTDMHDNPEKYGLILEQEKWYEHLDWSKRSIVGTEDLPPARIDYWLNRLYSEFIMMKDDHVNG